MRKSGPQVLGGALTIALLAVPFAPIASAAPPADSPAPAAHKEHDRPDPASDERRALNQKAVELVATGQRTVEDRGGSKAVRIAPGQYAQYGVEETDRLLTFLVEFGEQKDPRFPNAPAGPVHNAIPQPDRVKDNSTLWTSDFSREHFQEMFFGTEGESFAGVYEELSSGRYAVTGDTSDWVEVPWNSASYGQTESQVDMTRFIQDSANAWYAAEIAKGKTPAQVNAYLATFDEWDRYDYDKDGDFSEPDGYIDHFQAVRAGEDESAGAPSWMIWAHRWSVGQAGRGTSGPAFNKFGGVKVGASDFWIRDYTTEPENRQYLGLDTTLQQGPYNFGWGTSSPDRVEHFPYQDGLLISYWNTARTANTVARHPGEGLVLPVDARPTPLKWSDGTNARNRIQTFDATFGTEATDAISLHRETAAGMTTLQVPSSKAVPVFDDTDPNAYYDAANPLGSVKVAGTGTKIKVVQSNKQGMTTVQVQ